MHHYKRKRIQPRLTGWRKWLKTLLSILFWSRRDLYRSIWQRDLRE